MTINVPDVRRSTTLGVTVPTRAEYDPDAVVAELVMRFEVNGLLREGQPIPDPLGAHDAAELLLKALGVNPVDMGMSQRIARRVTALAGVR